MASGETDEALVHELWQAIADPPPSPAPLHPIDAWAKMRRQEHAGVFPGPVSSRSVLSLLPWLVGAGIVVAGLLYISQYGAHLKTRVVQQGNAAIAHLMSAKSELERMDWEAARDDFSQAKDRFDQAGQQLDVLGSSATKLVSKVPGLRSLSYGYDIFRAGQYVSDAGLAVSDALAVLAKSGSLLNSAADKRVAFGQVLRPLEEAMSRASKDLDQAIRLLGPIDARALPEDSRAQYNALKDRLPQIKELVGNGSDMAAFLSRLVGTDRPRRYLLLFQNSGELRPTGGFPGSYGLVTFEDGRLKDMQADDIYNPDGQIQGLIVPPLQLQHITPSWGMRDANWFIDFRASARKVAAYYQRGGGTAVDGVIAVRPEVLAAILRITGPVSLPQYDTVLDADNFIPTIQREVESVKTQKEPKKIIMDLAPVVLQRLASASPEQWAKVLDIFKRALDERDMLMYFDDKDMERLVGAQGWDGSVRDTEGDYLTVNISNIKGAKADAVTDTSVKLESWLQAGTMAHRLTLTRQHNGGKSEFGFYNKTNYSYVRVLVPLGSTLRGITGNDRPDNKPLMDYSRQPQPVRDADLTALESTYRYDAARGVTTSEESGKTGFGFWMKVEPGKTQQVQLEYAIPARFAAHNYRLYVQRQPGLDLSDFEFTLQKAAGVDVGTAQPPLTAWPDSWRLHDRLRRDLDLSIKLK